MDVRVIFEFECGRDTVRAGLNEYRGRQLIDLRHWYEPAPGADLCPGKGLSLPVEYVDELLEAAVALHRAVRGSAPESLDVKTDGATSARQPRRMPQHMAIPPRSEKTA